MKLNAISAAGAKVSTETVKFKSGDSIAGACKLANNTIYYFPIGLYEDLVKKGALVGFHAMWDATVVATLSVETCGQDDASDWSTVPGQWVKENPASAYVAVDPATAGTPTNLTVVTAGGGALAAQGGATFHLGGLALERVRLKVDVTTGGYVSVDAKAKQISR